MSKPILLVPLILKNPSEYNLLTSKQIKFVRCCNATLTLLAHFYLQVFVSLVPTRVGWGGPTFLWFFSKKTRVAGILPHSSGSLSLCFLRYNASWVHKSVWIHMWCCQPLPDVVSFSKGKRASQESPGSFKAGTKAYVDQGALYVKAMLGHVTHTPQNACHSSK